MTEEQRSLHLIGALGAVRTETLHGREHLVVPVVALMEGVIHAVNASTPERVTVATLAKAANSWNGRPLVLNHPTKDGHQISANDPKVLEAQSFGSIFNSRLQGKKLLMDAYVDVERAAKIGGPKFLERLKSGEACEVSVGAFVRTDAIAGVHDGKRFNSSWVDTTGDHLAFLPDGIGACSGSMGCGANRAAMRVCEESLELEALGGPGSGWHAEQGHVKASEAHANAAAAHREAARLGTSTSARHAHEITSKASSATKSTEGKPYGSSAAATYSKMAVGAKDAKSSETYHSMAASYHESAARQHSISAGNSKRESNKRNLEGAPMKGRSLRERVMALIQGGSTRSLSPAEDAAKEAAELVGYNTLLSLLEGVGGCRDEAEQLVQDLIDDEDEPTTTPEDEAAEEEVECARLEALQIHIMTMMSTLNNALSLTYKMLAPDLPEASDVRYAEALKALIGKKISAANMKTIQTAHDMSHDMHGSTTALGAQCNGMKVLEAAANETELKAACRCEGETDMTRKENQDALIALKDAAFTDEQKKGLGLLPDTMIASLHTLAAKHPAESIIQAKAAADAALAGHAHGLNAKDAAEAAAAKKKADEAAAASEEDGDSGKKMKAAKAAGFETVEEFERDEFYKKNPEIKALVDGAKAHATARKEELVAALKTAGSLSEEKLKLKTLEQLEELAAFAKVAEPPAFDYSGRGLAAADKTDVHLNPPDPYALAIEARKKAAVN